MFEKWCWMDFAAVSSAHSNYCISSWDKHSQTNLIKLRILRQNHQLDLNLEYRMRHAIVLVSLKSLTAASPPGHQSSIALNSVLFVAVRRWQQTLV